MYTIAISRTNAKVYYMGGTVHGLDLWTVLPREAAHYCTREQAETVAATLPRWVESSPDHALIEARWLRGEMT